MVIRAFRNHKVSWRPYGYRTKQGIRVRRIAVEVALLLNVHRPFITVTQTTQVYLEQFTIFNSVIVLNAKLTLGGINNA